MLAILNADGAFSLQQDACRMGLGLDAQIGPATRGIEEGARGGPAPALLLGNLIVSETLLLAVVVVAIAWPALGCRGIDEGVKQFGALDHVGDVQRAATAARLVATWLEMLGLPEIRQDCVVRPAAIAELRPGIVVKRVASDIQHTVDRTRATQRLAAWDWN